MTFRRLQYFAVVLVAFGLLAAACGDDDDGGAATTEGALTGVCPDPLVIQTDWFPEAEHGAMYELIGDDYTVDTNAKVVRGSLVLSGGVDSGIDVEVRTGGPAIGFTAPRVQAYTDNSIHLLYSSNDGQILNDDEVPTLAVVAPLDINPQIVMWDPATYPDIDTIADIGDAGVLVQIFAGGSFAEVFVAQGIWSADQVDPSYDGSPARFVAEQGAIAQQAFASAEPHLYENVFEEWSKPIAFELLHDAGYQQYSQPVAIRTGDLEELRGCLEEIVPIIQQAIVDFAGSPDRANAIIVDAVEQYADFWQYDMAVADFSVATQKELGLVGNGDDDTVGNFDLDRVQGLIDAMRAAGMNVPDGLEPSDIVTNEFIDESIGFG